MYPRLRHANVFTIYCFTSCFALSPYTCILVWGVLNVQRAPWVHWAVCEAELCPHPSAVSALPLQMGWATRTMTTASCSAACSTRSSSHKLLSSSAREFLGAFSSPATLLSNQALKKGQFLKQALGRAITLLKARVEGYNKPLQLEMESPSWAWGLR